MTQTDQRQFNCEHCGGVINIPANLPPTSAPCPYCQKLTTSPGPEEENVERNPVVKEMVEEKTIPAHSSAAQDAPRPKTEMPLETGTERKKSGGGKGLLILALLVLLSLLGLAVYFLQGKRLTPTTPERPTNSEPSKAVKKDPEIDYLNEGWKADASTVLKGFLAAKTPEEMAPFVIGGEEKIPDMRSYYEDRKHNNKGLKAEQFRHVSLVMADRERGIFMMDLQRAEQWSMKDFFRPLATREIRSNPETASFNVQMGAFVSNFTMDEERIFVFFKGKEKEMRMDWNVFVQTKDRLLMKFFRYPEAGKSEVFRGAIMEDVPIGVPGMTADSRVYRFADMAHPEDVVRVTVPNDSDEGRFLSELTWIGKGVQATAKNVTLELKWGTEAEPILKISRILCWEYLGVGGELRDEAKSGE